MENKTEQFVIRVYGILMDNHKRILLSDEFIRGKYYTKFPGGGLEFGEGTRDCLQREFKEETGLDVTVCEHIYTTDYFQLSAFDKQRQVISIYYFVSAEQSSSLKTKNKLFDFTPEQTADANVQCEVFRWVEFKDLNEDCVTLPIDKIVVKLLKKSPL